MLCGFDSSLRMRVVHAMQHAGSCLERRLMPRGGSAEAQVLRVSRIQVQMSKLNNSAMDIISSSVRRQEGRCWHLTLE